MYKIFTYSLFFLSFWAISQKNSVEVQYEDKDFVFLDSAYVDLLRDIHRELILQNEGCVFLETCEDTRTRNLGKVLFQMRANQIYQATYKKQPIYPRKAQETNMEGYVIIAFDIEIDGSTSNHDVIVGKCIKGRVYPYEDCRIFNSAALKAAKKNKFDLNTTEGITDVRFKYSFELEEEGRNTEKIYTDISDRVLRRAKNFQSNQEWANLKKLAESIDDNYIKFYWLGVASENLSDPDLALQNYIKSINLQGDPKTMAEVRNKTLSLLYGMNKFEPYAYICDKTYFFYDNYMCGMNMLQIGDSISGVTYLVEAYRKNLVDNNLNQIIAEIIESQKKWLTQDLTDLQSSL